MPLVAGVDSSTQSTKVEIRDADSGELVASGHAAHRGVTPPTSEQDPNSWWSAFESAWSQAMTEANAPTIAAISIAGQQHGMVALDAQDAVIRPAKLWNDTTSAPDADWLLGQLPGGAAGWAQACGSVPTAAFTISKLSWLHRSEPENWARLARVCLPHDWLTFKLTGAFVTDRGDASGTGYWSPGDGRYRFDLLAIVDPTRDWSTALPTVCDPIDVVGQWNGVTVGPGTGDNMAAALGLGVEPGDVVISIGTSGTVFAVSTESCADPSGAVAGFADATGRFLPLVCTLNAAKVTDAVGRLLGVDNAGLDSLALAGAAGADGLVLLPYLDGERTPNRPTATGVLSGLRSDVSREQFARAGFEGVVCGLLDALDALTHHTRLESDTIQLVGGGARSTAYRQILADLSGRSVVTSNTGEAVATGACVQAAAVLHRRGPEEVRSGWAIGSTEITEPADTDVTDEVRGAYAALRG